MGGLTDDGDVVLGGLELPESDIDGDTALALGLELVKNPGILEGALAELSGFLFATLSVFCVPRMVGKRVAMAADGGVNCLCPRKELRSAVCVPLPHQDKGGAVHKGRIAGQMRRHPETDFVRWEFPARAE